MEFLFLLGRLLFGGFFLLSGINHFKHSSDLIAYAKSKRVKPAKPAVQTSGVLFILGGLGIILGVYYQLALWLIIVTLTLITFKMHDFWRQENPEAKASDKRDFLKNMALIGGALIIASLPPVSWVFSLL